MADANASAVEPRAVCSSLMALANVTRFADGQLWQ